MLFRTREDRSVRDRFARLLWPRTSFARSARYVWLRLCRIDASPHRVAVGAAAGVFASITPLIGIQMAMAGVIAFVLRGSLAAAMLATFVGNPLTWPLFWAATYAAGVLIVGSPAEAAGMPRTAEQVWPVIYTMLIGSIPVGLFAAGGTYIATVQAAEAWRSGRRGGRAFVEAPIRPLADAGRRCAELASRAVRGAARDARRVSGKIDRSFEAIRRDWIEPTWRLW